MNSDLAILDAALPRVALRRPRVSPGHPTLPRKAVEPVKIRVSDHAYDRVKERMGLKGKNARKRIEDAWHKGMIDIEATGELALWIARKRSKNPDITSVRVLNGFAFLFAGAVCLTVLEVRE